MDITGTYMPARTRKEEQEGKSGNVSEGNWKVDAGKAHHHPPLRQRVPASSAQQREDWCQQSPHAARPSLPLRPRAGEALPSLQCALHHVLPLVL